MLSKLKEFRMEDNCMKEVKENQANSISEEELINNKTIRSKVMDKIEVLGKVKELLLLPNTELMTTNLAAEYFEVDREVINKSIQRNREELESNGLKVMKYREVKEFLNEETVSLYKISKRGVIVFPLKAVLCLATILSGSLIAQKIREEMSKSGNLEIYGMLVNNNSRVLQKQRDVHRILLESFDELFYVEDEIQCGDYYVDFVVSNKERSKSVAVEVDEFGHKDYNIESENEREKTIFETYDSLIRFNPDAENESVFQLVNSILKELM